MRIMVIKIGLDTDALILNRTKWINNSTCTVLVSLNVSVKVSHLLAALSGCPSWLLYSCLYLTFTDVYLPTLLNTENLWQCKSEN